jgi:hypothetical protein
MLQLRRSASLDEDFILLLQHSVDREQRAELQSRAATESKGQRAEQQKVETREQRA